MINSKDQTFPVIIGNRGTLWVIVFTRALSLAASMAFGLIDPVLEAELVAEGVFAFRQRLGSGTTEGLMF